MGNQRTANILTQLNADMQNKYTDGESYIRTLASMFSQYKAIADDLIKTKTRYVEIIERYTGVQDRRPIPSSLPGVVSASPMYSNPEMQGDTKELQQLGDMIGELENQKDLVYAQVRKLLEAVINTTSGLMDTANHIDDFLSASIVDSNPNGVYGNAKVNDRSLSS